MYKSILVPIDLAHPDGGKKVLGLVRAMTGADARICVLNVVEDVPGYVAAELPDGLIARNVAAAREQIAKIAAGAGAEAEVRVGHAAGTILDHARDIGADLIALGSHRPGLQDYFLGSTAARVVRHADCAVLVDR